MGRRAGTIAAYAGPFLLTVALLTAMLAPPVAAAPYPPLPFAGRSYFGNLSASPVAPGASTSVAFTVTNPGNRSLVGVLVTLGVYAFNGYPGDASAILPVANAPVLSNGTASGASVVVAVGTVVTGGTAHGSVAVTTSTDTPAGTFAVRIAVAFNVSGTAYRLESRGWFNETVWAAATIPNGTTGAPTLNLTRLGVSGVVPETAVLVTPSGWPIALGALLAGGFVLVGLGAWVYFRRGSRSRSGAG